MTSQTSPALSGFARLADRTGLDIRPTLLRVLTDLYVLKPSHTDEEERHYVELAMRLLDGVDIASRIALAERLSKFPAAPREIVRRLATDELDVAAPVLKHSNALDRAQLVTIAEECSAAHAAMISQRPDIQALLNGDGEPAAPAAPPVGARRADQPPAAPASLPVPPKVEPQAPKIEHKPAVIPDAERSRRLSELFLASESDERRVILLNLDYSPIAPAEAVTETRAREAVRKLERAALSRQPRAFATVMAECLGLSIRLTQELVEDSSGEPIVVLAKALRMPSDILQRVLLFLNPAIGESVKQVYDLATLYDELSSESALRLIAIWKTSDTRKLATHETAMWDDEVARARVSARPHVRAVAASAAPAAAPRRFHGGLAVRS